MITRTEYMTNSANLHHSYYLEVAKASGISYANSADLQLIKSSLASDKHLNNIPLEVWDRRARISQPAISRALKERGDFYSFAGGVCTHKAAAIEAANQSLKEPIT